MRLLFFAVPAWDVTSTKAGTYRTRVNTNPDIWTEIDLGRAPSATTTSTPLGWQDVIVDDHVNAGGWTTVPKSPLPSGEKDEGALWPTDDYLRELQLQAGGTLPWPNPDYAARPYELMGVLYVSLGRIWQRYRGFHARVVKAVNDTTATVEIWHAGDSKAPSPAHPPVTVDVDFSSRDVCDRHVSMGGLTELLPDAIGSEGALFMSTQQVQSIPLLGPKVPLASGLP